MKNILYILLCTIGFILLYVVGLLISRNWANNKTLNNDFNIYLGKNIKGVEVMTIINKAINENEKNKVKKDERNYYLENDKDSIKIFIKINEQEFTMEDIYNNGQLDFIRYFNSFNFKCTNIEYHRSTGKIKNILIEENTK